MPMKTFAQKFLQDFCDAKEDLYNHTAPEGEAGCVLDSSQDSTVVEYEIIMPRQPIKARKKKICRGTQYKKL